MEIIMNKKLLSLLLVLGTVAAPTWAMDSSDTESNASSTGYRTAEESAVLKTYLNAQTQTDEKEYDTKGLKKELDREKKIRERLEKELAQTQQLLAFTATIAACSALYIEYKKY
ncbi:MAG: hypothetical protein ACJAZS_000612 [Alteromonas naphthalenivorans]|jgi:hypothetical protein